MLRQELSGLPRMNEVMLPGHASPVITQPCTLVRTLSKYGPYPQRICLHRQQQHGQLHATSA